MTGRERKIVQIATLPGMLLPGPKGEDGSEGQPTLAPAVLFAVCDDGTLFEMMLTNLVGVPPKWVPAVPLPDKPDLAPVPKSTPVPSGGKRRG